MGPSLDDYQPRSQTQKNEDWSFVGKFHAVVFVKLSYRAHIPQRMLKMSWLFATIMLKVVLHL